MGRTTSAKPRRALGARTMPEAFRRTVEDHPDRVAVRTKDDEVSLTWFFAVPRSFEKLKAGMEGHLSTQGDQTLGWLAAARCKVELGQAGEPVPVRRGTPARSTLCTAEERRYQASPRGRRLRIGGLRPRVVRLSRGRPGHERHLQVG